MAYRAKNFLGGAARLVGQSGPYRWLYIGALVARIAEMRHAAAGDHGRTFFHRQAVVGQDFVAMPVRDQRPHIDPLAMREIDFQRLGLLLDGGHKLLE